MVCNNSLESGSIIQPLFVSFRRVVYASLCVGYHTLKKMKRGKHCLYAFVHTYFYFFASTHKQSEAASDFVVKHRLVEKKAA